MKMESIGADDVAGEGVMEVSSHGSSHIDTGDFEKGLRVGLGR